MSCDTPLRDSSKNPDLAIPHVPHSALLMQTAHLLDSRYSVYTVVSHRRSTLWTTSVPLIGCKRFPTKGLCATCCGPTLMTVVDGGYPLVEQDTPSGRISRKRSTTITVLLLLPGHTNWLWKVCAFHASIMTNLETEMLSHLYRVQLGSGQERGDYLQCTKLLLSLRQPGRHHGD